MAQNKPLISVIIPTRDRPEHLLRAVESVLAQTWKSIEVIVVDDGSVDDIGTILQNSFSNKIIYIKHRDSLGACAARNTGLRTARGEYIAFLDDDDRWLPNKLAIQISLFLLDGSERLAMVSCGFMYELNGVVVEQNIPTPEGSCFERFLSGNWLGSTSLPLIRKSCLDLVGNFDPALVSCQDWDLWLRLCQVYDVDIVKEPLVVRGVHSGQMSTDLKKRTEGRRLFLSKHFEKLKNYPNALVAHQRRLGTFELLLGEKKKAKEYYCNALRTNIWDWRSWAGLIMLALPVQQRNRLLLSFAAIHVIGNKKLYH